MRCRFRAGPGFLGNFDIPSSYILLYGNFGSRSWIRDACIHGFFDSSASGRLPSISILADNVCLAACAMTDLVTEDCFQKDEHCSSELCLYKPMINQCWPVPSTSLGWRCLAAIPTAALEFEPADGECPKPLCRDFLLTSRGFRLWVRVPPVPNNWGFILHG